MKILITGCNGFIGSYLVSRLGRIPEIELIVVSRSAPRVVPPNATPEILDITNGKQVSYCMARYIPDVVVHCAAMASVDMCESNKEEAWRVNVEATYGLLGEAEKWSAHFVFLSTDFVFSGRDRSYTESDIPNPVSFYGITKHQAEQYVMQSSTPWTLVRPVLVFGHSKPFMRKNVFSWIYGELKQGATMQLVDDQVRTPTYVEDLAWALTQIVLHKITGTIHIGGFEVLSVYAFGLRLAHYFQFATENLLPIPSKSLPGANLRPQRTVFNNLKAQRLLNYQPTPLEASFQQLKECLTD